MGGGELVGESAAGLAEALPDGGALIGLDLGTKTIGIAVCDAGWRFASALKTLPRGKFGRDRDELRKMIEARSVRGIVIGLLGLTFFIAAFNQAKKGITGSFMNRISPQAPDFTRWIGGAGYLARAVVFVVIGWSLVGAGFLSQGSDQVKTIGDAVASLADDGIWFTITAIGLLLFGLFSFILARYRIIPDLGSDGKVPEFRAG